MKLLVDMNLSPLWVEFFVSYGFESIHWSDIGRPSAPDKEILEYAARNRLVVFTHDLGLWRASRSEQSVIAERCVDSRSGRPPQSDW